MDYPPEPPKPISLKEAALAVDTLHQFFEENHFSMDHIEYLRERMNEIDAMKANKLKQLIIIHHRCISYKMIHSWVFSEIYSLFRHSPNPLAIGLNEGRRINEC